MRVGRLQAAHRRGAECRRHPRCEGERPPQRRGERALPLRRRRALHAEARQGGKRARRSDDGPAPRRQRPEVPAKSADAETKAGCVRFLQPGDPRKGLARAGGRRVSGGMGNAGGYVSGNGTCGVRGGNDEEGINTIVDDEKH